MELGTVAQVATFAVFSAITVLGALGMATTMNMFRSGLFLMASFVGAGGLFILLAADLVGMLQVMMYLGGMLVMILFMVWFGHAPHEHHEGMTMTTPIQKLAAGLAASTGATLVVLLVAVRTWPVVQLEPDPRSAEVIGHLLMSKYMIAFEGAGLMILLGIFGSVYLARPRRRRPIPSRDRQRAAVREGGS